jgi:uncharacterized repeat protein (TIGR01451 family)
MATNVIIDDPLPEGWNAMGEKSKTSLTFNAGSLAAGESREFEAFVKSTKTGRFVNKATATADGGLTAEATSTTTVHQPILAITKTGREWQFAGRDITYNIKLTNTGDWNAQDTIIEDRLPSNVLASTVIPGDAGEYLEKEHKVIWNLGTLKPKESREVSVTVTAPKEVDVILRNTAEATAYCADSVSATVATTIRGIPAILLEVVDEDDDDPAQVGQEVHYTITVTNQGSKADENIEITCTLGTEVEYVSSTPTPVSVAGDVLTFNKDTLKPGEKTSWDVYVKVIKASDKYRFKVSMMSDELKGEKKPGEKEPDPVTETEATRLYE